MAALPPSVAQVPGKYLCFRVTRFNERNTIDPEHVMLALTRLRDFMIERGIMEVSMPVYNPNRGKLSPKELYAFLHEYRLSYGGERRSRVGGTFGS